MFMGDGRTMMRKRKPSDIKYSDNHIWARLEGEKDAIIGITDHAIKGWSEVVSVDLPKKGDKAKQDSPIAEIESEDHSLSVISPVSGKILAVNKEVAKHNSLVLEEPFEDGWLVKIRIDDISEFNTLLDRIEYEERIDGEDDDVDIYSANPDEND